MIGFLILSLLSGVLELGSVWYAWNAGLPTAAILLYALSYQLGNLLFLPGLATRRRVTALCMGGMLLLCINMFLNSLLLLWLEITIASLCLQASRAGCKSRCRTWLKRIFRAIGFVPAPIFMFFPQIVTGLCFLAAMAAILSCGREPVTLAKSGRKPLLFSPVMFFHQLHYFAYAYIMPVSFAALTGSVMAGASAFALTWLVYLLPQPLAEAFAKRSGGIPYRKLFFCGHCFLALVMAGLSMAVSAENIAVLCIVWALTGLGGGTVFCIGHLTPRCEEMDMDFSEKLGHVLGPLAAIPVVLAFPGSEDAALAALSCALVCLTLWAAGNIIRKEEKKYGLYPLFPFKITRF